jgi:TolB protein
MRVPRSLLVVSFLLSSTTPRAAVAEAPVVGDIEGAEFRPYPIAVADFRVPVSSDPALGNDALRLTQVVRADLDLSGIFKVLPPKSFIDTDGLTLTTIKWDDWLNVGADGLVKATVRAEGDELAVEVRTFQVAAQREALSKSFKGKRADARALAHTVADAIYRSFTQEPSPFKTKVVAVKKVGGEKHLVLMDFDGENQVQVTKEGGLNLLPSFAPDGRSLLFTSYRYDNPDLFEMPLGGARASASRTDRA